MAEKFEPTFLQKVVGFAEATNLMMKEAEDKRTALRKEAEATFAVLQKAGKATDADKESIIDGFVNTPEMALKLAAAAIKEASEMEMKIEKEDSKEDKEDKKEDKKEEENEYEVSIGKADEKKAQVTSSARKSDEVWERGFGFGG